MTSVPEQQQLTFFEANFDGVEALVECQAPPTFVEGNNSGSGISSAKIVPCVFEAHPAVMILLSTSRPRASAEVSVKLVQMKTSNMNNSSSIHQIAQQQHHSVYDSRRITERNENEEDPLATALHILNGSQPQQQNQQEGLIMKVFNPPPPPYSPKNNVHQ